ncbi:hypothetical protein KUL152_10100 [Tenacibaculum sp. KUL152]|nr:hypothetical protein KUL152_10100 [Tenacibaculum sp. KUL152]
MNNQYRKQIQEIISDSDISEAEFFSATGLSTNALQNNIDDAMVKRLQAVLAIFTKVTNWFNSPVERWKWFTTSTILGFSNKTPAQIIREDDAQSVDALLLFVKSKELGGFE